MNKPCNITLGLCQQLTILSPLLAEVTFSKPRPEIIGHSLEELHGSETFQLLKRGIDEAISQCKTSIIELWERYPDGTEHFIQAKYHPSYDSEKNITGVSPVARDLSELKQTQDALANSQQRLQSLYDDTPSMFFTLGEDRTVQSVNAYGARELGYQINELVGNPIHDLFYPDDHHQLNFAINNCFADFGSVQHWELRKKHKNGATIWVKETARLVQDQAQNDQLFIVSEDISERHKLSQKLSFQASHDALTDFIHHHEFGRLIQQLLDSVIEEKAEHVMCYLDLDQFKIINDSCRHLTGDTLLKILSSLLHPKIRKGDTLARLGGDEFGILMAHCSVGNAKTIAESIRQLIQDFNFICQDKTYAIGASIGLVAIDKGTDSIATIMGAVGTACYAAKDVGRNRIVIYSETDREVNQRRGDMRWVRRIQEALELNKFCLYGQKIVNVNPSNTNKQSYELLIRLREDDGEIISPNAFLPAAERYNLAKKIDQWVVQNIFAWLVSLGSGIDDFKYCTINLSGNSIDDTSFLSFVIFQVEQSEIPGHKIYFEIK